MREQTGFVDLTGTDPSLWRPEGVSPRRRRFIRAGVVFAIVGLSFILFRTWQKAEEGMERLVAEAAARHRLDRDLVAAVVEAESGGNARAVSRARAYGLMQLRIPTASEMAGRPVGIEELFDPAFNLDLGCRYLRHMLDLHGNNVVLALMAYNAGPGNVNKWRAREPETQKILADHAFPETRAYVTKVLRTARSRRSQ